MLTHGKQPVCRHCYTVFLYMPELSAALQLRSSVNQAASLCGQCHGISWAYTLLHRHVQGMYCFTCSAGHLILHHAVLHSERPAAFKGPGAEKLGATKPDSLGTLDPKLQGRIAESFLALSLSLFIITSSCLLPIL